MSLKPPIGIDDFATIRTGSYFFVDKSLFIEEVVENSALVQLITRPRRFGKTLNMSMLAHFYDHHGMHRELFAGLAVEQRPSFQKQGGHPALFLSFKDLKARSYALFLDLYRTMLADLFLKHLYLREDLDSYEQERFENTLRGQENEGLLMRALHWLTELLQRHHQKKGYLTELKQAGVSRYSEIAVAFHGKDVAVRANHFPLS